MVYVVSDRSYCCVYDNLLLYVKTMIDDYIAYEHTTNFLCNIWRSFNFNPPNQKCNYKVKPKRNKWHFNAVYYKQQRNPQCERKIVQYKYNGKPQFFYDYCLLHNNNLDTKEIGYCLNCLDNLRKTDIINDWNWDLLKVPPELV
jgi:hypothetical protein